MNEENFGITPGNSAAEATYKDRSSGLVIFGILTILMGCLCVLLIGLVMLGTAVSAKTAGAPPAPSLGPVVGIYGGLAVVLVWLGIGSTMCRRWARALLLIGSWTWLIIGLAGLVFMGFLLPGIMANVPTSGPNGQAMPAGAVQAGMIFGFGFMAVFMVILPGIWVLFYNSRHVKATCEARDPVTRWTDACPLPVMGICLWAAFSAVSMLLVLISGHGVMPFFGMFISGIAGVALILVLAALWGYAAFLMYKLNVTGWWLALIIMCVFSASSLVTFSLHSTAEMYRQMHYSDAQLTQLQKIGFLTGNSMVWIVVCSMLPFVAYLLFIKRYFRATA